MKIFSEYLDNPMADKKNEEQLMLESGFSRILQIMSGLVPSVKTFAIVTWENPQSIKFSDEYNKEQNKKLKGLLEDGSYGYVHIKGRYGSYENPFFIMNITKNAAIELGKMGDAKKSDKTKWQESIIFGTVNAPEDITFELVYMDGRPSLVRHVWKQLDKGTPNYYSEFKGRKFVIPFFDATHGDTEFKKGKIVRKESIEYGNNIFYEKDFDTTTVEKANKDAEFYDIINEDSNGKHLWLGRGHIHATLATLKKNKNEKFSEYLDNPSSTITESSLSRLHKHMLEHDSGTITTYRNQYTHKQNQQRNRSLSAKLATKRYDVTIVDGSYIEDFETDKAVEVGEKVFFVVDYKNRGKLEKDLRAFGEEFSQDSIMFIPKGGVDAYLIGTNPNATSDAFLQYGEKKQLKNAVWGKEGQFMTKVRGRPFYFKENAQASAIVLPEGYFGRYSCHAIAESKWEELEV